METGCLKKFMGELSVTSLRPDASALPMFAQFLLKEWAIVSLSSFHIVKNFLICYYSKYVLLILKMYF